MLRNKLFSFYNVRISINAPSGAAAYDALCNTVLGPHIPELVADFGTHTYAPITKDGRATRHRLTSALYPLPGSARERVKIGRVGAKDPRQRAIDALLLAVQASLCNMRDSEQDVNEATGEVLGDIEHLTRCATTLSEFSTVKVG